MLPAGERLGVERGFRRNTGLFLRFSVTWLSPIRLRFEDELHPLRFPANYPRIQSSSRHSRDFELPLVVVPLLQKRNCHKVAKPTEVYPQRENHTNHSLESLGNGCFCKFTVD